MQESFPSHGERRAHSGTLRGSMWVAVSYSRGSSQPRDLTQVSLVFCIGQWILYHCTTWETQVNKD